MSNALHIATYIVSWTSFLIAIATCILRCYCCRIVKRSWKADDFMSIAIGAFLIGALVLWQRALALGCAKPELNKCNYLDPSGSTLTWFFVTSIIYDAVLHFIVRAAFFTFYLQISAQSNFKLWIGLGFGMDGMLLIFNLLIIVFRCQPVTAAFRPMERMAAHCMDTGFALLAPAILNALLNLYVLILPMPIMYLIQLPIRRKRYICWIFAIGSAAVALGFIRIHSLLALDTGVRTSENVGEMMIVAALGMSLGTIAYNLPSMRVLWHNILKPRSTTKHTSQRLREVETRDKLQKSTLYGPRSVGDGVGSFSRPYRSTASAMNLVDRPLPALPNVAREPRYPLVNDAFGSRPRTPPCVP